mgnify:CR=1 FL=1
METSTSQSFEKVDIPSKGITTKRSATIIDGKCDGVDIMINGQFSVPPKLSLEFIERLGMLIEQYRIRRV